MRRILNITIIISISFLIIFSCKKKRASDQEQSNWKVLSRESTGINFKNELKDSDSLNILTYLYYYNGGGVAAGDINNDGLPDLFFAGNETSNKLYLNQGKLKFKDITDKAGVDSKDEWSTGVSMVDINGDGWLDIYVCQVDHIVHSPGRNRLFINNKDLTFREAAAEYGLAFKGLGTQAAFFDYDHDGDLDCYLLNHSLKDPEQFKSAKITRLIYEDASGDRLLQNNGGKFTDQTEAAGIFRSTIGFGLGIDVGDVNRDGWPDIYIGNDFHENDYLYLNNQDGTFREVIKDVTGHTSNFTMGVAIADINNDAWPDIFSLDMRPEDETVYKQSGGWETYNIYSFKRSFGYHHQSPRNALQINAGTGHSNPVFTELACQYGVEATDWSWSPLIADFNGDGSKDIFISNGIQRRPNDLDFVNYYSNDNIHESNTGLKLINTIPEGGATNYLYISDPTTHQFTRQLVNDPGTQITNGATYSDLDQDGDLDIICNKLNNTSSIIENQNPVKQFLSIQVRDAAPNIYGIGTQITVYQQGDLQYQYLQQTAGFQSGKEAIGYFGIKDAPIDSVIIQWPDGVCQYYQNLKTGFNIIERKEGDKVSHCVEGVASISRNSILLHSENPAIDLTTEKWMPYSLSTFGPRMAIGKAYYYITGAQSRGSLHLISNDKDVTHLIKNIPARESGLDENDAAFADYNGDGLEDLFITIGGNVSPFDNVNYKDEIFFGQQDGSFALNESSLPKINRNSSVVRPCDFDKDGDIDVFVGTLSRPGNYGWSEPSILYINQGKGQFTTQELPVWEMVFDAEWHDMDMDSIEDLVILGHWMPITILYNRKTHWEKSIIPQSEGLWFCLEIADINADLVPDIITGNFGLNHSFGADTANPLILYLNDFDLNGQSDPVLTYVQKGKRYVYPNLELFLQQLPSRKKDFLFNKNFAGKEVTEIFTESQLEKSTQRKCKNLASGVFFSDKSKGNWTFASLPFSLQSSPIWSIAALNKNTFAFGGNFYDVDPNWGRQDALFLTVLKYHSGAGWINDNVHLDYFQRKQIRDLQVVNSQLYIACNNDSLVVIPFAPVQ
ncbi:MAG: VCBS repeat-containing protein [Bacteroidota bacterium]|nr:VCBS repeat-containing protein [Bacteroidota bacterium]